ncbi:MAG: cytochrome c oxidase subunit II [Methylobacteriaceae bacterium]|nr:cytochrome c oxidase subunit II [Methylobacteriaceae bacterium]
MRAGRRLAIGVGLGLGLGGCSGSQSALDAHGAQASALRDLMGLFTVVCGTVWLLVLLALAVAVWRRRASGREPAEPGATSERRLGIVVGVAVALTVLTITGLTFASYRTTRGLTGIADEGVTIRLRGYQWWWEATYQDQAPERVFRTANELRIPVGRPVRVELAGVDVIHSFWVPSLAGKQDIIPGRQNEITLKAERPGIYRGQCAEFCGLQHAHMAFLVIAELPENYEAWRSAQLRAAEPPADPEAARGRDVFLAKSCKACHAIRGTPAGGVLGPDLTHVASRETIAAGLLPTTRGSLAAWVADPQTVKPGSKMPLVPLDADELRAVSAYLASLK